MSKFAFYRFLLSILLLFSFVTLIGQSHIKYTEKIRLNYNQKKDSAALNLIFLSLENNNEKKTPEDWFIAYNLLKRFDFKAYSLFCLMRIEHEDSLLKVHRKTYKKEIKKNNVSALNQIKKLKELQKLIKKQAYSAAITLANQLLTFDPKNLKARLFKMEILANQRRYDELTNEFQAYLQITKHDPLPYELLVLTYNKQQNQPEAIKICNELSKVNPSKALLLKALVEDHFKNYTLAYTLLDSAGVIDSSISYQSDYLLEIQKRDTLENVYQTILLSETDTGVLNHLGLNFYRYAKLEESTNVFQLAIEKGSTNPEVFYKLGNTIINRADSLYDGSPLYIKAALYISKAFTFDSTNINYAYRSANYFKKGKDLAQAIFYIDKAISLDSLNYNNWDLKASIFREADSSNLILSNLGKEAVLLFTAAYQKDSSSAKIANSLGMSYKLAIDTTFPDLAIESETKAINFLQKAISIDSSISYYYGDLNNLYKFSFFKEQYDSAIVRLNLQMIKNLPKNGGGYANLFWFYFNKKDYRQANHYYVAINTEAPNYWGTNQINREVATKETSNLYDWTQI